jgi:hypothetical protein
LHGGFLERLEDRRLLAIVATFDDGVLTFTGDSSNNQLTIAANNAESSEVGFSSSTDDPIVLVGATNPQQSVTGIIVELGDGTNDSLTIHGSSSADTISVDGTTLSFISALALDVAYTLSSVENLMIDGQDGNDAISASGASVSGDLSFSGGPGADALSVAGPFLAGSLTVEDFDGDDVELSGTSLAAVTTHGDQTFDVPVTLIADTTLAGNDISLNSTVNSAVASRSLEVRTHSAGVTTFGGSIGGTFALASITTNADGTTRINGRSITTIGDQHFGENAIIDDRFNFPTSLTSIAGAVRFDGTLNSFQHHEESLEIDAAVETVFNGEVGTAPNGVLRSFTTNANAANGAGVTRINGGAIFTVGNQRFGENVTLDAADNSTTLSAHGASSVWFEATINSWQHSEEDLQIFAGSGVSLDGVVGGAAGGRLDDLHVEAGNFINLQQINVTGTAALLAAAGAVGGVFDAAVDVIATRLIASSDDGIGLDTTIERLTIIGSFRGVGIDETDDLIVESVIANETVDLRAGGAIREDADAAADVTAPSLILQAGGGIDLDTAVNNVIARNDGSGDILIDEVHGLKVTLANNASGNIRIVATGGAMNITSANSTGSFICGTGESSSAGDNLSISGQVTARSFVTLVAGDNITLGANSDVRSTDAFVYMKTDALDLDAAGGTTLLLGLLRGNNALQYPLVVEGGVDNDLFSIQRLPQSPIAILARGGLLDNTFVVFTEAADDIRVFATIVDLVGRQGIEITYVDNEQLDLLTLGGDDKIFVRMPEPIHGILAGIIRMTTGAGDDSLVINGSLLNDVIRVASYTSDKSYRFQVRGDTGETECLQVFGFLGNDIIENSAPIAALLDGGSGQDAITGSDHSLHPVTGAEVYDVIFGGADADSLFDPFLGQSGLSGRAGNDFIYADHDYNLGAPASAMSDGDGVSGGLGSDSIVSLGTDLIRRGSDDFVSSLVPAEITGLLQAGLAKKCAKPIRRD